MLDQSLDACSLCVCEEIVYVYELVICLCRRDTKREGKEVNLPDGKKNGRKRLKVVGQRSVSQGA